MHGGNLGGRWELVLVSWNVVKEGMWYEEMMDCHWVEWENQSFRGCLRKEVVNLVRKYHDDPTVNESEIFVLLR